MDAISELFLSFNDPMWSANHWRGSLRFDPVNGSEARIISQLEDSQTDLRKPFHPHAYAALEVEADLSRDAVLFDLSDRGHSLSMSQDVFQAEARFVANAVAIGPKGAMAVLASKKAVFSISSPAVFAFLDQKPYEFSVLNRQKRFNIKDKYLKPKTFQSQIFEKIQFHIGKSGGDSVTSDKIGIQYNAGLSLKPRRKMDLISIYRVCQIVEKIIFIMLGSYCGPMKILISNQRRMPPIFSIHCSSALYHKIDVISGLDRCWTLGKLDLDFGNILDRAFATFQTIETAIELILASDATDVVQDKFFKLVRALENIGRNLFPKGSETAPVELSTLQTLIQDHGSPNDLEFFQKRITPIFTRPNSLGYSIDYAKQLFPFSPIVSLEKAAITRLRGIEAHAMTHQFSPSELQEMQFYASVLDFVCRGCLLLQLGLTPDQVVGGIVPHSRFRWFVREAPPESAPTTISEDQILSATVHSV
jgi:hypothetical protein